MSKRRPKTLGGDIAKNRFFILDKITKCQSYDEFSEALKEYYGNKKQGKYTISGTVDVSLFNANTQQEETWQKNINEAIQAQQIKFPNPALIQNAEPSANLVHEVPVQDNNNQASSSDQGLDTVNKQQAAQETRIKELTRVTAELGNIVNKCKQMETKGNDYKEALGAVKRIHNAINELAEEYVQNGDLEHFQNQTKALLKKDNPDMTIVNTHRGWEKNFFGNLGLFILGLGVGYLAVCAYRGSFFNFNTDSANHIDALETQVNAVRVTS